MDNFQIDKILKQFPKTADIYHGTLSGDDEIIINHYPALFVINTASKSEIGEHWCVAYFRSKHTCELFDSYGLPPQMYMFYTNILKHAKTINFNTFRIQGHLPTCGHHCIFFAIQRCSGHSAKQILNTMYVANDIEFNDRLVIHFIRSNFGDVYAEFLPI